ncbi:MAG: glycoside hydrolase family 15 [Beutenbergiaceae bacterium]
MDRKVAVSTAAIAAIALMLGATAVPSSARYDEAGSYSDGVALASDGSVVLLPANSAAHLLPGSRVLAPRAPGSGRFLGSGPSPAQELAAAQREWLTQGWLPEDVQYRELVRNALLDMRVLSTNGATTAAGNPNWRYVWPRDASFVAVTFAATGHLQEAVEILEFLQDVQSEDGSFEARYLPDGSGPPDDRLPQTDGTGWVLWALDALIAAAPGEQSEQLLQQFEPLRERSSAFLLDQVDNPHSLPPPSPDYWEHREEVLTLGTAAPVLIGLEAAARLASERSDSNGYQDATDAAADLREAIIGAFGGHGYGRYPGPSHADAAVAFLLPPFQTSALPEAQQAWAESIPLMGRPAGGLAPGAGWTEQNQSWTPQTALYALVAAASGDQDRARAWLDWLADHRTPLGALPEKVNADGEPAGPAPLAWTCALVVLTVMELER